MADEKKKPAGKGGAQKPDLYEQTTQKIIELMETGKLPWQKGWDENVGAALVCPINGKSGHRYSRINSVFLSWIMAEKESNDPRFFTMAMLNGQNYAFRERVAELKEQGKPVNPEMEWQYGVKKGAKSVLVQMSWKQRTDKDGNPLPEEEQYWAKRFCHVFHASDCVRREYLRDKDGNPVLNADGKHAYKDHPLKPYIPKERGYTHEEQYEIAEGILKASGAVIKHDVPATTPYPCYVPLSDEIHLPPKEAYPSLGEYYATALHELAHWTSHKDRLDRSLTGEHHTSAYAQEELRAELASTYLSLDLGLPMNPTNHAAYVQAWVKRLKEDKMEIFHASAEARKIADYIKGFMPERFRVEDMTVATEGVVIDPPTSDKDMPAKDAATPVPMLDDMLPIPVTDTKALTLPPEAQAHGTARFYKYHLTRPADAGALPKEHLYLVDPDDSSGRYGAAYYEKQLPASVAASYELTPDYNYFANKSMHVTIYQRKKDAEPSKMPHLNRDYEITAQENYVRTDMMRERGLDRIVAHFCVHPPQEGRFLAEGDLIETDGRVFRVTDVGFAEQELNAHKGDFVLTPLADERVGQLRSAAQESVGEDTYKLYCDKIRETFYRAAQTEDALRVHPGVFVETNDPQEGERLALDAGYAKGFRERTYQHGLSSYTPNDEIGWRKADTEFAETTLKSSMESDPEAIERIDTLRASIADAIQRNSPYAAISQDRSYGKQLVQNAEKRASVRRLISEQKARAEERNTESAVAYSR